MYGTLRIKIKESFPFTLGMKLTTENPYLAFYMGYETTKKGTIFTWTGKRKKNHKFDNFGFNIKKEKKWK